MLGSINPQLREVTVIGGGIAGLLAAYYLDRAGYRVTLIEAGPRLGGLVQTRETPYGIAENGPHSLMVSAQVQELFSDLGVPLVEVEKGSEARFVLRRGRLRRFPLSPGEAIKTGLNLFFKQGRGNSPVEHQVTLEDFALRHLSQPALEYLVNPFLRGIYAARPSEISLKAAFSRIPVPGPHETLLRALRRSRKKAVSKLRPKMMAPAQGMGSLVSALEHALKERLKDRVVTGHARESIPDAGNLVLCTPAFQTAKFLKNSSPELSEMLSRVSYTPMVSVTAFAPKDSFSRPPRGVGVLFPEKESRQALGILFNSSAFSGRVTDPDLCSLTLMFGGTAAPHWVDADDHEIRTACQSELEEILGLKQSAVHFEISRSHRAIPLYGAHLFETWKCVQETWCREPGRILFGNYTGQVSIRGMIETAASANL